MLPYLDVFDNLAFKVDGYNVTLLGSGDAAYPEIGRGEGGEGN